MVQVQVAQVVVAAIVVVVGVKAIMKIMETMTSELVFAESNAGLLFRSELSSPLIVFLHLFALSYDAS